MTDTVMKVIRIPRDDVDWFDETYPAYGSWTWFIRTALRNFRREHDLTPQDLITKSVKAAKQER